MLAACSESAEPAATSDASNVTEEDAGRTVALDAATSGDAADARASDASAPEASAEAGRDVDSAPDARVDALDARAAVLDAGIDANTRACTAVDVVWIQDSSGSVLHAQSAMQANFAELVRRIEQGGEDLNVILLAPSPSVADAGAASDPAWIHHVQTVVDSKAVFTVALGQFSSYASYLRPGAATHIVGVTDDNDLLPAQQFEQEMEQLLGHGFTFHAVASPAVDGSPCISEDQLWNNLCTAPIPAVCAASAVGTNYYELAAQTSGEQVSICAHAWTPLLDRLTAEACP
jgi:hypothetical protein